MWFLTVTYHDGSHEMVTGFETREAAWAWRKANVRGLATVRAMRSLGA